MAEYIEKDFVIYTLKHFGNMLTWTTDEVISECVRVITENKPLADVQEIKHGYWFEGEEPLGWSTVDCAVCSVCDETFILDEYGMDEIREYWKYCPNCGAKMNAEG